MFQGTKQGEQENVGGLSLPSSASNETIKCGSEYQSKYCGHSLNLNMLIIKTPVLILVFLIPFVLDQRAFSMQQEDPLKNFLKSYPLEAALSATVLEQVESTASVITPKQDLLSRIAVPLSFSSLITHPISPCNPGNF